MDARRWNYLYKAVEEGEMPEGLTPKEQNNQDSVYDADVGGCWFNPFYNENENPISGAGINTSYEERWEDV